MSQISNDYENQQISTGGRSTTEIDQGTVNSLGFYGIDGNVSEYCFDWAPEYNNKYRMKRGWAWYSAQIKEGIEYINYVHPGVSDLAIGFRIARSL
ncbi:MAG: SUMF1/EgtB/PvdO family nonheme iron enzyme [Spirochaetaceae bacterium]|nr:SUMF1/EgtB/PvdO family nonheme iron enzyme [Spirochaetaceae bacterium]